MRRAAWMCVILLLLVAPTLDFAWNEPALAQSPGARCQLHATPAATFEAAYLAGPLAAEFLSPAEPIELPPWVGPSIFIPPRL